MLTDMVSICRTHTGWAGVAAPIFNCLFVVAQDVNHRRVLHEHGLKGRRMTRNMMSMRLSVPRSKIESTEVLCPNRETESTELEEQEQAYLSTSEVVVV